MLLVVAIAAMSLMTTVTTVTTLEPRGQVLIVLISAATIFIALETAAATIPTLSKLVFLELWQFSRPSNFEIYMAPGSLMLKHIFEPLSIINLDIKNRSSVIFEAPHALDILCD